MVDSITATFEDGVFKPDTKLDLSEGAKFQLIVTPSTHSIAARRQAFAELERFRAENPIDSAGERLTRDELHERH
jgi:predicted DNA-binding antitoxin AbrB/MazE fold protein